MECMYVTNQQLSRSFTIISISGDTCIVRKFSGWCCLGGYTITRAVENDISSSEGNNNADDESPPIAINADSYPIRKEFEKLIQEKSTSSKISYDEPMPHRTSSIILDEET
ncbi:hypothetical protein GCK32_006309 [Trichostrongylus colubriformis]|uniref:Uncharacterized protein n=1 Tax=Trichostrongylus colubriformis TaxID=6319 RepID=A0AAN8F1W0_TRICO